MRDSDKNVETALLQSAKQAFLKNGFEGASLRKICTDAGVTTGAVYFFFRSKEEIFDRLVQPTIAEAETLCSQLLKAELTNPSLGIENDRKLTTFLYTHREEIQLLTEKSKGTKYKNYKDTLLTWLETAFLRFFETWHIETDSELIRILAEMRLKGYLEITNGGYDMERMLALSEKIGIYADGGFRSLLKNNNTIQRT